MSHSSIEALRAAGVSVWLDDLSRTRLADGSLHRLISRGGVSGVTTNPSIFMNALRHSSLYTEDIQRLHREGLTADQSVLEIMCSDVAQACDQFALVHESTGGNDGFVSLEVSPELAHDTEATVAQARELATRVGRNNVMMKIPATNAGINAVTQTLAAGISVNVTLIFDAARYRQVIEATVEGMRQAQRNGHDLSRVHSVASFFVSRIDTTLESRGFVQPMSNQPGEHGITAAVHNAREAARIYFSFLNSPEAAWLIEQHATPQRLLFASTGVKNAAYRPTLYVDTLVAPATVNTMPEPTYNALTDLDAEQITAKWITEPESVSLSELLNSQGFDLDALVAELEQVGLQQFEDAWRTLIELVESEKE